MRDAMLPLMPTEPAVRGGDRPVRVLAAARCVSVAGSQAAQLAVAFTVFEKTRSSAWVSAALFATAAVTGLLAPVSGWLADRLDHRTVMVASEAAGGRRGSPCWWLDRPRG